MNNWWQPDRTRTQHRGWSTEYLLARRAVLSLSPITAVECWSYENYKQPQNNHHTVIRQVSVCLSVCPSVTRFARKPFARFASNSANVLLRTRRCAVWFEFVRMWSNYRIKRLLSGVRYAFYANVMLRLWSPRVTNCAIVSPRSQLHAVLTVPIPGEARSLMVSTVAWHARVRRFTPRTNLKKCSRFFCISIYRKAFC